MGTERGEHSETGGDTRGDRGHQRTGRPASNKARQGDREKKGTAEYDLTALLNTLGGQRRGGTGKRGDWNRQAAFHHP